MKIVSQIDDTTNPIPPLSRALTLGAAVFLALGLSSPAPAAISVGASGSAIQDFATRPAATEWSTLTWTGTSADIATTADMDAAVQALTAAGTATQVGTNGTNPPGANALPRQNSNTMVLAMQMRPTAAVKGCVLMAKLQNTSGGGIDNLEISYDFIMPAAGVIPVTGLRAYYSMTGLANSWTVIPAFCTSTPGALKAVVALTSTWADATPMYVVWVDDNSALPAASDTWTMIDNVSFGKAGTGARITAFDFGLPVYGSATIAGTNISINVPAGTNVSALTPTFTLSDGAICDLATGSLHDFSSTSVTYTVTPLVGTPVAYTVTVNQKTVTDISTAIGPLTEGGLTIDNVVPAGNFGRLVGPSQTYWASIISRDLLLNGNTLTLINGGNARNYTGAISGDGVLVLQDNLNTIAGFTGNTYTGTTTVKGSATLGKGSGNALSGTITLNAGAGLIWAGSNQINDASDMTLAAGAYLNISSYTETIKDLYLVTGCYVQTGALGVLKVARLFINGTQQSETAYIAGDGYVLGSGYIEVGASGPPVYATVPTIPATPVPDGTTAVHPAMLTKLDWADCSLATSYDVYLWLSTATKPVTPTATCLLSEYILSSQVLSLSTYKWQVVAKNSTGPTAGPEWTFTTLDRTLISNYLGIAPEGAAAGIQIDNTVGLGNAGTLVGTTRSHWNSALVSVNLNLNGNLLWIERGGNPNFTLSGAITGDGLVTIEGCPSNLSINGSTGNTYTGTTTMKSTATLAKSAGNALCGTISVNNGVSLIWAAANQISDLSAVTLVQTGSTLNLAGFSDTIASLTLATGASVATGTVTGGVLTVTTLTVGGSVMPAGTYTFATNPEFVTGLGSVVVPTVGTPYELWAKDHAGGATAAASADYNNDGVSNGVAYFMGMNGLATNPGVVNGKVTWPHVGTVASWGVQVSDNLFDWAPAASGDVDIVSSPGNVIYTLPTGAPQKFCRLMVVP